MIDEHVHCGQCGRPIATQVKLAGGKTKPAQIRAGQQLRPAPAPNGITFIPIQVPLCDTCAEAIDAAEQRAKSKLIVPSLPGLPGGQPL